jgi:hypothetical protein
MAVLVEDLEHQARCYESELAASLLLKPAEYLTAAAGSLTKFKT